MLHCSGLDCAWFLGVGASLVMDPRDIGLAVALCVDKTPADVRGLTTLLPKCRLTRHMPILREETISSKCQTGRWCLKGTSLPLFCCVRVENQGLPPSSVSSRSMREINSSDFLISGFGNRILKFIRLLCGFLSESSERTISGQKGQNTHTRTRHRQTRTSSQRPYALMF